MDILLTHRKNRVLESYPMEIHSLSRFLSIEQPSTASTTHAAVMGKSSSPATPRWLVVSMVTAEQSLPVGPVGQRWHCTKVPKNYPFRLAGLAQHTHIWFSEYIIFSSISVIQPGNVWGFPATKPFLRRVHFSDLTVAAFGGKYDPHE